MDVANKICPSPVLTFAACRFAASLSPFCLSKRARFGDAQLECRSGGSCKILRNERLALTYSEVADNALPNW